MITKYEFFEKYYKYFLLVVFLCIWVWSVWRPASEENWFLENKMVFLCLPATYFILVWYIKFSKLSLTMVTIFVSLHVVGAHYGYGSVPLGNALGGILGADQNVYDKIVHFSFGLLIAYPLREFFLRVAGQKGFWSYLSPFMGILTLGALYEVFEWVTVLTYDPAVAYLFIGGNDPFDATKDLLACAIGALLTLSLVALLERAESKYMFRKKMKDSFKRDDLTYPIEDEHLHKNLEQIN
jgi:putative membrane protein